MGKKIINILGWSLVAVSILTACKDAQWYLNKAEQKGAVIEPVTEWKYEIKHDTIYEAGKPVIVQKIDSFEVEKFKIQYVPLTRQERLALKDKLKFEYKQREDSLDAVVDMYEDSLKAAVKLNRQDNRNERALNKCTWWIRLMGRFWWIPAIITFLLGLYFNRFWRGIKKYFENYS